MKKLNKLKTQRNQGLKSSQNYDTKPLQKKALLILIFSILASVALMTTGAYASVEQNLINTTDFSNKYNLTDSVSLDAGAHNYSDGQVVSNSSTANADLPGSFDMRDKGWVSKVRLQNPWGSCWAHAITAASEVSITHDLVEAGYKVDDLDMSEHHLSWFAKTHLPEKGQATNSAATQETNKAASDNLSTGSKYNNQEGEGTYFKDEIGSKRMDAGSSYYGTAAYASGTGIVSEQFCPYKGTNGWVYGSDGKTYSSYDECKKAGVEPRWYSAEDDWSLSEDIRFTQNLQLQESNMLPNLMVKDGSGYTLDQKALKAAKNEIYNGRALSISYKADQATEPGLGRYMNVVEDPSGNKTFNQYTWEKLPIDHLVCIVGWDDDYSASNFTINPVKWDKLGREVYKLTGIELSNDDAGQPYYEQKGTLDKVYVDTKNEKWVVKTEKVDDKGHIIYKLTEEELVRDATGYPLVPGTDQQMPGLPAVQQILTLAREGVSYTPPGNGAWIVKNSWGAESQDFPNHNKWGNNGEGYFYISYYDLSVTNMETFDFDVEQAGEQTHDYAYCAQYDYMIGNQITSLNSGSNIYMANTFTATDTYSIKNLSCNTARPDTTVNYKLYLLNDGSQNPTDGQLVAEETAKYDFGGYHRVDLSKPVVVKAGQKYSIVAEETRQVTSENGNKKNWDFVFGIGLGQYFGGQEQASYCKAIVNEGESTLGALGIDGTTKWIDWRQFINESKEMKPYKDEGCEIDNFSLKAYADPIDFNVNCSSTEGGSLSANPTKAVAGTKIALTVTPNSGYELEALKVVDADGNNIEIAADNTFVMPSSDVNATASFKAKAKPQDDPTDPKGGGSGTTNGDGSSGGDTAAATGDNLNLCLLIFALVVSSGVCCGVTLYRRRCVAVR